MTLTGLKSVRGIKTYDQDRALVDYFCFQGELLADGRIQALMGTLTDRQNIVSLADICARCPTNGPSKTTAVTDDLFMYAHAIKSHGVENVYVQHCGKCRRVVTTPIAEQCNWCGHEWRGQNPLRTLWNEIATSTRENRDGLPPAPAISPDTEQSSGGLPPVPVPPRKSPPRGNTASRSGAAGSMEPSNCRRVSNYALKPEDQAEVERFHQMFIEDRKWDDRKYLSKQLSDFKVAAKHYPQYPWGSTQVASLGHCLQMHFVDIGIIERYLNNDLERMRACLSLSARAGFLMGVGGTKAYSGGYDCSHAYDMINAAMCGDWEVLERFAQVFRGPFKSGHRELVMLCNGLYIALGHSIGDKALTDLRTAKASKHSRALYDALIAIIERSPERLTMALKNVIKLHRKLDHTGSLKMMLCIPAHALHRIWTRSGGQSLAVNLEGYLWDDAVDLAFSDGQVAIKHPLHDLNPVLSTWINNLPERPDIHHLLDSIQVP